MHFLILYIIYHCHFLYILAVIILNIQKVILKDDKSQRFIDNENLLKINYYENREKIHEQETNYNKQNKKLINNIMIELNNYEFLYEEIRKFIRDDYLKFNTIKIIEKKQVNDYRINENVLNIILLIIKIKFEKDDK